MIGPEVPLAPIPECAFDALDDIIERRGMQAEQEQILEDWERDGSPWKGSVPGDSSDKQPEQRKGGMRAKVTERMTRAEARIHGLRRDWKLSSSNSQHNGREVDTHTF